MMQSGAAVPQQCRTSLKLLLATSLAASRAHAINQIMYARGGAGLGVCRGARVQLPA